MRERTDIVHRHRLPNGLQVCVVTRPTMPMVAVNLTYRVGSRDERDGLRGFAHLFEHLMFQGSEHVKAGQLSALMSQNGANPNASTHLDLTNYYETVSVGALELALWLEADRMGGMLAALDQTVLDNEREVVKNERRQQMESQPFGLAYELLYGAIYPDKHPYHLLPIGLMADIDAATLTDVREFFTTHYAPDNAVLTMVGAVTPDEGFALAAKYFGGIPASGALPATPATPVPTLGGQVRIDADEPMPVPGVYWTYPVPGQQHPDQAALVLACAVLGGGPSARVSHRLAWKEQLAQDIAIDYAPAHGESCVVFATVIGNSGVSTTLLEQVLEEEIHRLTTEAPSLEELNRARAWTERGLLESTCTLEGLASLIGETEAFRPGYDPITDQLNELDAVQPADIVRVVARWMRPDNRVALTYQEDVSGDTSDTGSSEPMTDDDAEMEMSR